MSLQEILFIFLFVLGACANPLSKDSGKTTCGYANCPQYNPNVLNVHIVPHSHDDVGWLKTVDQYYFGGEDRIQVASVQNIYDSVFKALKKNHDRRFVAVEMAFFSRWWQDQTDATKIEGKAMVERGQLEFVGAGWSMNDEAAAYYSDIVDQMTFGQKFLADTFGECARPLTVWPLDPFGHSKEQANLFAQMGFDGMFFARQDWREKAKRRADKSMEFIWEAGNLGDDVGSIFGGALNNHYSAPSGYCFDVFCSRDAPIVDDPESPEYNVDSRVEGFLNYVRNNTDYFLGNNFLVLMGDDFQYQFAHNNYKNMDKLIKYINAKTTETQIQAYYSSPACYTKARNDELLQWPTLQTDFFPYASDPHAYWTGYFTSRPSQKRIIREAGKLLQASKQLEVLASGQSSFSSPSAELVKLMKAQGINQHHDAVTGTEKQAVTSDYVRITHDAMENAYKSVSKSLTTAFNLPEQTFCSKLNVSECAIVKDASKFVVTVYNQLSNPKDLIVRIPVSETSYVVKGYEQEVLDSVASQIVPISAAVMGLAERDEGAAEYELVFVAADVPPLGFRSYHVESAPPGSIGGSYLSSAVDATDFAGSISNGVLTLNFSNGLLKTIAKGGVTESLDHNIYYYNGAIGDNNGFDNRASGAYIFRPVNSTIYPVGEVSELKIVQGTVVQEAWQTFGEWGSNVFRLYTQSEIVEAEWLIGPIPGSLLTGGKEVVSRYSTDIDSGKEFYTDSNGRQTLQRVLNKRPTWDLIDDVEPVAGNYYPINSHIYIEDESGKGLVLINDRAQGGSSLESGQLELMVHRRCFYDDAFGVGESLDEPGFDSTESGLVSRGKHQLYYKFGDGDSSLAVQYRSANLLVNKGPLLGFTVTDLSVDEWFNSFPKSASGMEVALPENVQILTLEPWHDGEALLRIEHVYEEGEDIEMSDPVTFNIKDVFPPDFFTSIEEYSLSANQKLAEMTRLTWSKQSGTETDKLKLSPVKLSVKMEVTLNPMDIRTFILRK